MARSSSSSGSRTSGSVGGGTLTVQRKGSLTVVELQEGSLVNRTELERVCAAIDQVIDSTNPPEVVLSFASVNHVSSTFLGKLIAFHKKAKQRGGRIALTNVNANLSELFTVTKLSSQIPIFKPGEKVLPTTVAWVTLFAVTTGSALIGAYFIYYVARGGWSSSSGRAGADWSARAAIIYFILTIPLAAAVYWVRRIFVQIGRDVQWVAVGVVSVLTMVLFLLFLFSWRSAG